MFLDSFGKTGNEVSATLKRSVSEYMFPSSQKRHRKPSSDQFKKVESELSVRTL